MLGSTPPPNPAQTGKPTPLYGGGRCGPYALSLFYSMSSRGTSIIRRIERERYVPVAPSPPPLPLPPLTFRSFYHPPSLYSSPSPPPSSVPSTSATPVEEVAAMKVSLTAAPAAMASNASTSTSALHKEVPLGTSNPVNPYPSSLPKRGRVIPSPSLTPVEREAPAVPALSHAYAAQSTPTPTPPPPSPSLIPRLPELVAIKPRETNRLNIRPLEERKAGAAASVVDIRNRNNCWKENNRTKSWDVQGLSPGVGIVNPLKVGVASRCDCYKSATAKDCSHCGNKATVSDPNDRRGTARCQTETVSASTGTGTATAAVQPILSDGGLGGHGHGPGPAKQSNDGSKDGCDSKKEPSSIPHLLPSLLPQSTSIVATPTPALQGTTLQTSQKLKSDSGQLSTTGANSIPVGIAVARQRQQSDSNVNIAPDLRPRNRPLTTRLKDSPADVSNLPAMTVLACEDHSTNSYSPWPPQPLPQWQYPSAVPLEQPLPFHPPVGFQLARDSVSGQFLLIPPSQPNLDSLQRTVVWPNNMTAAQPLLLPAQPSHHVVVDRLVAVAAAPASNESSKRKSQSATIMKIEDSPITGMMMSCEYSKSSQSSVTQQNGLALIQPLQNNQSSLISQPHFSTISSSGSVLIQHISGTSSITPTLQLNPQQLSTNNTTNSLLIASAQQLSTDATSAHSLLNQHSSGSLVINTQEIGSQIIGQFNLNQHHPALINNISALNQPFVSTANLSSTNHQSFVNLSSSNNQSAFVSTTNIISPNFSNHQTSVNMLAPNNDLHSTNQNNFISTDNMMNYCRPPTINIISPDLNLHSPVLPNSSSSFVTSTKICAPTVIPSQENTGKTDNNSDLSGDHQSLLKYAVPEPSNSSAPSFVLKNYHTQGIAQQQLSDQHHQPIRKLIHASVATSISSCDEDDYTDSNKEEENERVETKFNEKSDSDSENSDKNDNDTTSRGDCSNSYNNDRITIISKSDNCSNSNIYHVRMANDVENVCNNNFSGNASCGNVDADLYNDEDEESNDELGKPTGCVKSLEKSQSRSQATSPVTFASSNSESEESEEIEDVETMVAHILARDVCSGVNDPPNLHNSWKIKKELDELSNNHKSSIDLSGLELLSNSIEQFEHKLIKEEENLPEIKVKSESSKACEMISDCSSVMEDEVKPVKECPTPPPSLTESTEVEDPENLSGLGLLCALAHQRYIEEEIAVDSDHNSEHTSDNCTLRHGSSNHHNYHSREAEIEAKKIIASKQYNSYMRPTSPEYDSAEMEMRCRIAELQKIYQQKQRELSKLTPRKYRTSESSTASNPSTTTAPSTPAPPTPAPVVKRGPGRPRKNFDSDLSKSPKKKDSSYDPLSPFSFSSPKKTNKGDFTNVLKRKRSESPVGRKKQRQLSTETGDLSPPVLEPMCPAAPNLSTKLDVLKPPTLTPSRSIDCKLADIKSNKTAHKSPFRMYERKSISQNNSRCSSPFNQDSDSSVDAITPLSPPCLSPMSSSPLVSPPSSSKKRKVGRPRKHTDNHSNNLTETLVSKTPRVPSKNNLVGLIISSKPSHQSSRLKCDKNSVNGDKCSKQTPLTHSHDSSLLHKSSSSSKFSPTFMNSLDEDYKPNKIRPKLKAEAKVKSWVGEEDDILDWTTNLPPDDTKRSNFPDCLTPKTDFLQRHQLAKNKCVLTSTPSSKPCSRKPGVLVKKSKMITEATAKSETRKSLSEMHSNLKPESECQPLMADESLSCSITQEHLLADRPPFRCLINIGGLFYAGQLTAIEPPDLYGLMLDGERGHRNHIHTKEEILNQAVLEVKLSRMPPIGSRVCAYWSQQYRCLYPGTVSSSSSPMQNEMKHASEKFISVEFDDGDSGRILVEDVRLLPQDYPIVVYDPNPLMSLGKRKRRISSMSYDSNPKDKPLEETSHTSVSDARESSSTNIPSPDFHGNGCSNSEDKTSLKHSDDYKEKKRLKKRYRKKHGLSDDSSSSLKRERKRHRSSSNESKDKVRRHHKHKRKRHKHKHQNESSKNDSSRSSYSPVENIVSKSIDDDDNLGDNDDVEDEDREPPKLYGTSSRDGTSTSPEKNLEKLSSSCDIDVKTSKVKEVHAEPKKKKERQHSTENSSKMAPFLPARRLWSWTGKGYKRPGAKGRGRKEYYKSIQRGSEVITVGDCAVFLSTGRPDRPYIGRIEAMWESWGSSMVVKVKWFYHPEETVGCTQELPFPGALFESPHFDENDVQTISHKCEVLPLSQYKQRLDLEPHRLVTVYDQNDIYYLAGFYDPTSMVISFEPDIQKKK